MEKCESIGYLYRGGAVFADGSYSKGCHLGTGVFLNKGAFVLNSEINTNSRIGFNTKVLYASVGKFCSISWDCSIGGANHDIYKVSTYNFNQENHYHDAECRIGNDVWIGAGTNILRGVSIGDGSVVGAGSVVTHDVLPYEIVAGVPAKHIGWRFDENLRERLMKIQWWNYPLEVIDKNRDLFGMNTSEEVLHRIESLLNTQKK